jgi:hypothetical protein
MRIDVMVLSQLKGEREMLRKVARHSSAACLPPGRDMNANELQVNYGRCGKSMIVRLAAIYGKRLVNCVDCELAVQRQSAFRIVRDTTHPDCRSSERGSADESLSPGQFSYGTWNQSQLTESLLGGKYDEAEATRRSCSAIARFEQNKGRLGRRQCTRDEDLPPTLICAWCTVVLRASSPRKGRSDGSTSL